jgi:hypothetical protein
MPLRTAVNKSPPLDVTSNGRNILAAISEKTAKYFIDNLDMGEILTLESLNPRILDP